MDEALRFADESPESASLYDHAGDIALKLSDRRQAAKYWKKALSLTTDRSLRYRLLRKLRRRWVRVYLSFNSWSSCPNNSKSFTHFWIFYSQWNQYSA